MFTIIQTCLLHSPIRSRQAGKEEVNLKSVFVGKEATILSGKCAGITGMVVGADSNTAEIRVEPDTYIITTYDNIAQE